METRKVSFGNQYTKNTTRTVELHGNAILLARLYRGYSQREASIFSGLTSNTISELELNKSSGVKSTLAKVAVAYDMSITALLSFDKRVWDIIKSGETGRIV